MQISKDQTSNESAPSTRSYPFRRLDNTIINVKVMENITSIRSMESKSSSVSQPIEQNPAAPPGNCKRAKHKYYCFFLCCDDGNTRGGWKGRVVVCWDFAALEAHCYCCYSPSFGVSCPTRLLFPGLSRSRRLHSPQRIMRRWSC